MRKIAGENASRNVRWHLCVLLASLLALSACSKRGGDESIAIESPASEIARPQACMSGVDLAKYGTHFARKDVWDRLPAARTLGEAYGDYDVVAIDITQFGVIGELGWHEGPDVCVQVRDDQMWARLLDSGSEAWKGPFISVDASQGVDAAYINRIFGGTCFDSKEDGHWCFKNGSIQVGANVLKAKVVMDTSEMPSYGIPVQVEGDLEKFWVFVRVRDGWRVFKDEYLTRPGHVDIDPEKAPFWRELIIQK